MMIASASGSRIAWFIAALFGLALTAGLLSPAAAATTTGPAATTGPATPEVSVTLVSASPAALRASDTLTLTARVANGTPDAIDNPTLTLGVDRREITNRTALDSWATTDPGSRLGTQIMSQDLAPLQASKSTDVAFSVPATDLGVTARSDWGPHGLVLTLYDGATIVGALRTFVVWAPATDVVPIGLTFLAAITGPAVNVQDPVAREAALTSATGADGRLGRVLGATAQVPEVGWAVDPALVPAATASGVPAVTTWGQALLTAANTRTVFALRAYDPDLAAFAHAPHIALPTAAPLSSGAWDEWRTDLAWPADVTPDIPTASLAAESGARYIVAGGDAMTPTKATYTTTALAAVPTAPAPLTALLADQTLSDLVEHATAATQVDDTQRLLAETAMIARERPAEQRTLLVALSRSWNPDPEAFASQVAVLRGVPWVKFTSVDTLLTAKVPSVTRVDLPKESDSPGAASAAQLTTLQRARTQVAQFAQVTADPGVTSASLEPVFAAPAAVVYRADPGARAAAVARAQASATAVMHSVKALPQAKFNLSAEQGDLFVRVRNTGEADVTVQVVLVPNSNRLQVEQTPTVTVPAGEESKVMVPVRAGGRADVRVDVQLRSVTDPPGSGFVVGEPSSLMVSVRVNWDRAGTAVMTACVVAIVVAGIWRAVRRGRNPRRRGRIA